VNFLALLSAREAFCGSRQFQCVVPLVEGVDIRAEKYHFRELTKRNMAGCGV
jgi:hypothetical protein